MRAVVLGLAAAVIAGGPALAQVRHDPELAAAIRMEADGGAQARLERLAESGDPVAVAVLEGYQALWSDPGYRGIAAACTRWESVSATSAEATHLTAACFEQGSPDWPQDKERAVELYRIAGEAGLGRSWCAIGGLHAKGWLVESDPALAVELCRRGADMGDPDAQADLGGLYYTGATVPQDSAEARRWFRAASAGNHRNADFALGMIYADGDGVERDAEAAVRHWTRAHDLGHRGAAERIAALYLAQADSDTENLDLLRQAGAWYDKAGPFLSPRGQESLRSVRERLSGVTGGND